MAVGFVALCARCEPGRAKRRRVVRGRRGLAGAAASPSRRSAIVGRRCFAGPQGSRGVPQRSGGTKLRRDRGREGDLDVPSRILRAGAQSQVLLSSAAPRGDFLNALWIAESNGVLKVATATGKILFEIREGRDLRAVTVDERRGVLWAYGGGRLSAYEFSGSHRLTVIVPPPHEEDTGKEEEEDDTHLALSADATDGSVWLGVQKALHHFSSTGERLATLTLEHPVQAFALDTARGQLWVATKKQLASYGRDNQKISTLDLARKGADLRDIAYDASLDQLWVAFKDSVQRYTFSGQRVYERNIEHLVRIASDGQGNLWAATRKQLLRFNSAGALSLQLEPFDGKHKLLALVADPADLSAWVADKRQLVHVGPQGDTRHRLELDKTKIHALGLYVDRIAPVLNFTAPVSGSYLSSKQPVLHLTYSDIGSGVDPATLAITDFGAPRIVTCLYPDAARATCTPATGLTEGAHALSATVRDYAGNISAAAQLSFTVDTIPPVISVLTPSDGQQINEAEQHFTGQLSEYAMLTLNGRAVTLNPNNQFSHLVTLQEGQNTFNLIATDRAGNVGTLTLKVTYNPIKVTITSPQQGSSLTTDHVLVTGTYKGPPNTGITVNGVVAETVGEQFYANQVPLTAGSNLLTATATTPAGAIATHSVTVTSTGQPPQFQITADPQSGIAPLKTGYTVTNNGTASISKIEADYDGNGAVDYTTTNPNTPLEYTYTAPGVYQAKITVTDSQNTRYSQTLAIVVYDAAQMDQKFTALWSGLNDALKAKDTAKALKYLNAQAQAKYGPVFTALLPHMPEIIASYSPPQRVEISSDIGEYAINRTVNGQNQIFLIYFKRDEDDGIWRLDSM